MRNIAEYLNEQNDRIVISTNGMSVLKVNLTTGKTVLVSGLNIEGIRREMNAFIRNDHAHELHIIE